MTELLRPRVAFPPDTVLGSSTAPMYPPRFFPPQPPPSPCPTQWNVPYSLFPRRPYQIVAFALPVLISAPISFVVPP